MDGSGPHRVRGDSRSRPNSPASVEGMDKSPMLHRFVSKVKQHEVLWILSNR